MVTIRDVAEKAGVSRSTVSRLISGTGYVGGETRERIEAAIAELGFVPNAMARGLKTQRSGLVALLVPEIVNSFYTTISRGVEDVANEHGLQVIVGNTDESVEKERAYVDLMVASRVDGVIVAPAGRSVRHLRPLLSKEVPTVLIDRSLEGIDLDIVRGDSVDAAATLTRHLLGLGHRRIAFINGDIDTSVARERETGFRLALAESGVEVDPTLASAGTWFIDDAERRTEELLGSGAPFTAVVAANNFMAIGALKALRRHGRRVPEDVALVCIDDLEQAALIDPFLTVAAQPAYTMGTTAMHLLIERLSGRHVGEGRRVTLGTRLLVRRSCGSAMAEGNGHGKWAEIAGATADGRR